MDRARYADLFRTESRDQLSAINRALLQLEQGATGREPVDAVFRAVHSLKGMAATMGYAAVAEFAHTLESLLDQVRSGAQALTPELMDLCFAGADALEQGVEQAAEDAPMSAAMREVLGRLQAHTPRPQTVRVTQAADAMLPGVRAFMVVEKLRALGEVVACAPDAATLQAATVPQQFAVTLLTAAEPTALEAAARSAGEVETVTVEAGSAPARRASEQVTYNRRSSDLYRTEELLGTAEHAVPAAPRARSVRVELSRLDALLNLTGELVIARGRLQRLVRGLAEPALHEAVADASRLIGDLQAEVMTSRLVPVAQVFDRFPRLVRDLARQLGKEVAFVVEGQGIELDRSVLDEIGDAVVHLLRNAVDHGLEGPAAREAAGKPRIGRLTLAAQRDRNSVLLSVRDDGRGIDRAQVLARALEAGIVPEGTARLDDGQLLQCLAAPGFSTAATVTDVSGRGVGIDAVQAKVRALGGALGIETAPGEGTTVWVRLPVTLAIVRALLARVGDEHYALPLTHVRETLDAAPAEIAQVQGRDVLRLREEELPLVRLRDVVQLPGARGALEEIVVIARGDRRAGLVVDELTGQEDIVVKAFDAVKDGTTLFSGATILPDGAPALIVDVGSLL